jgi:hypothetical protein
VIGASPPSALQSGDPAERRETPPPGLRREGGSRGPLWHSLNAAPATESGEGCEDTPDARVDEQSAARNEVHGEAQSRAAVALETMTRAPTDPTGTSRLRPAQLITRRGAPA